MGASRICVTIDCRMTRRRWRLSRLITWPHRRRLWCRFSVRCRRECRRQAGPTATRTAPSRPSPASRASRNPANPRESSSRLNETLPSSAPLPSSVEPEAPRLLSYTPASTRSSSYSLPALLPFFSLSSRRYILLINFFSFFHPHIYQEKEKYTYLYSFTCLILTPLHSFSLSLSLVDVSFLLVVVV